MQSFILLSTCWREHVNWVRLIITNLYCVIKIVINWMFTYLRFLVIRTWGWLWKLHLGLVFNLHKVSFSHSLPDVMIIVLISASGEFTSSCPCRLIFFLYRCGRLVEIVVFRLGHSDDRWNFIIKILLLSLIHTIFNDFKRVVLLQFGRLIMIYTQLRLFTIASDRRGDFPLMLLGYWLVHVIWNLNWIHFLVVVSYILLVANRWLNLLNQVKFIFLC